LALEQKLTISVSKILGVSGSFLRGNRDKLEYIKQPAYAMQIEAARNINVVLYDTMSQIGWLVDGASALLQMVRTQVVRKPYDGSDSHRAGENFTASEFLHSISSGGQNAASEALLNECNMKHIVLREFNSYADETFAPQSPHAITSNAGPSKAGPSCSASNSKAPAATTEKQEVYKSTCFKELVSQAWSTLEQIYDRQIDIETTHTAKELSYKHKAMLEGYEFMDIVSARHILRRRFIELKSNGLAWVAFAKHIHTITLFGQRFGDLYKPAPDAEVEICEPWRFTPRGYEHLVAPISLLREIKERSWMDGDVDRQSYELAQGRFWYPSLEMFATCRPDCNHDLESRVQQLKARPSEDKRLNFMPSWAQLEHENGAILFGKDSKVDTTISLSPSTLVVEHRDRSFQESGLGSSLHQSTTTSPSAAGSSSEGRDTTPNKSATLATTVVPDISTEEQVAASNLGDTDTLDHQHSTPSSIGAKMGSKSPHDYLVDIGTIESGNKEPCNHTFLSSEKGQRQRTLFALTLAIETTIRSSRKKQSVMRRVWDKLTRTLRW
jgi:hypothetical protein